MILRFMYLLTLALFTAACNCELANNMANPPQQAFLQINTDDCASVCVFGIQIGETAFEDARTEILANVDTDQIEFNGPFGMDFKVEINGSEVDGYITRATHPDEAYVQHIALRSVYPGEVTTLGELVQAGFEPDRVFRNRVNGPNVVNLLVIFDDPRVVATIVAVNQVDDSASVVRLDIVSEAWATFIPAYHPDFRSYDTEIEWLGFTNIEDYLSE